MDNSWCRTTPIGEIIVGLATVVIVAVYGPKVIDGLVEAITSIDGPTTTIGSYDKMSQKINRDNFAQRGTNNGKLQEDELEAILARKAAGTASSSDLQKLKRHQKNTGERNSRQSKDRK